MLKRLWNNCKKLRFRLLAIIALCWLLPMLVLGVYMSGVFFDALRSKTEQALVAGASHAQDLTVQEIERIIKKSKDVTYDDELYTNLQDYREGRLRYEDFYIRCRTYWHRMFQRERGMIFTAFFLIDEPENMIHTANDANQVRVFNQTVLPYIMTVGETLDTDSRFIYLNDTLYHVRNLYNRRMERFGMLVLGLEPQTLLSPLMDEKLNMGGAVDIILDEYRHIADPSRPFELGEYQAGTYEADGDLYYSQQVKSYDYELTYRIRLDRAAVFGQVSEYYWLIFALLILLVPLEALMMLFIYNSLTRPLTRLGEGAQRLAGGELGIIIPVRGDNEISQVSRAFNSMSLQLQEHVDRAYREELALRDARIAALQSRIDPHFLNNALELMNWQARLDGAETVGQMIEAMSTLINAALDRSDERLVPIKVEIEVADAYCYFIQQRFSDRVRIERNIDPELLEVPVPRLVIQTLLENAVEHGVSPAGSGEIWLDIYRQDALLHIDVRNNGRVITPEDQARVDQLLAEENRDMHASHVGIRNVSMRLRLIYQGSAGLIIRKGAGDETLARIYLPLEA